MLLHFPSCRYLGRKVETWTSFANGKKNSEGGLLKYSWQTKFVLHYSKWRSEAAVDKNKIFSLSPSYFFCNIKGPIFILIIIRLFKVLYCE